MRGTRCSDLDFGGNNLRTMVVSLVVSVVVALAGARNATDSPGKGFTRGPAYLEALSVPCFAVKTLGLEQYRALKAYGARDAVLQLMSKTSHAFRSAASVQ